MTAWPIPTSPFISLPLHPAPDRQGYERQPSGAMEPRRFYREAFYKTMAARLGRGGAPAPGTGPLSVVTLSGGTFTRITKFTNAKDAQRVQQQCAADGCVLVGDQPGQPIFPISPLAHLKQVLPDRRRPAAVAVFERN
jgi:hypothetical protein